MFPRYAGWVARVATLAFAIWAATTVVASVERGHVGLLSEGEKSAIVAAQGNPAPPPCYAVASLICGMTTADGTPTPCGSSPYPNCGGSSEGGCSGTNTSWECWQSGTGNFAKCPTFGTLSGGTTNCGRATTGGGCSPYTTNTGQSGCAADSGQPYSPNQGCGLANGKAINLVPRCVQGVGN